MNYIPIIGLEIHAELKTQSKMFCSCPNGMGLEQEPNIHICPVCTAQPGTLPVPNREAIRSVIKVGLATHCDIAEISKFDRKNYFYPDLPKGYQISQYDKPLCENGYVSLKNGTQINITRIHLEEDTGKLNHELDPQYSHVDYNRAGVPLMELVTEPDIRNADQAKEFCQQLQLLLRYLGVSDAEMEKGHMRCEANISILPEGVEAIMENFGTKVEVKNLNSFKSVEKAILYEIDRQTRLLEEGGKVEQETRGWDEGKLATYAQRKKEGAADYRYFPEPDIPNIKLTEDGENNGIAISEIRSTIPELPTPKYQRFTTEYKMNKDDADLIVSNKDLADYTEKVLSEMKEWYDSHKEAGKKLGTWEDNQEKLVKMATGWTVSKLFKLLKDNQEEITDIKVTPENFAQLIVLLFMETINSTGGQIILEEMYTKGGDPQEIMKEKNLLQLDDGDQMNEIIETIINNFPDQIEQYKAGKETVLQFLLGQIMKESKGKANPQKAILALKEKLK